MEVCCCGSFAQPMQNQSDLVTTSWKRNYSTGMHFNSQTSLQVTLIRSISRSDLVNRHNDDSFTASRGSPPCYTHRVIRSNDWIYNGNIQEYAC